MRVREIAHRCVREVGITVCCCGASMVASALTGTFADCGGIERLSNGGLRESAGVEPPRSRQFE